MYYINYRTFSSEIVFINGAAAISCSWLAEIVTEIFWHSVTVYACYRIPLNFTHSPKLFNWDLGIFFILGIKSISLDLYIIIIIIIIIYFINISHFIFWDLGGHTL